MPTESDRGWLIAKVRLTLAIDAADRARKVVGVVHDAIHFSAIQQTPMNVQRNALAQAFQMRGYLFTDLAEPLRTKEEMTAASEARQYVMSLGFNPWPSASGWAPTDLPWKERRLLIGIVDGVASVARAAHAAWHSSHPSEDCDIVGCSLSPEPPCSCDEPDSPA